MVELSCSLIPSREDGRVLVAQRSQSKRDHPGCWETIGGGMTEGESPEQCIRREVREELGVEIHRLALVDAHLERGQSVVYVNLIYAGELRDAVRVNDEIEAVEWISIAEIESRRWFPSTEAKLRRFFSLQK